MTANADSLRLAAAAAVAAECWEALGDNAFRFTCPEAELIAAFLTAFGGPGDEFLTLHAKGDDDPDDIHRAGYLAAQNDRSEAR